MALMPSDPEDEQELPEWELLEEAGIDLTATRGLWEQLRAAYNPDSWGYAQLGDLEDRQRAVVSDQLLSNCWSVFVNMIEANVHLEAYRTYGTGTRQTTPADRLQDRRRDYVSYANIASFFRAFGSTLDCFAGVAVAVLRIPRSGGADVENLRLGGSRGVARLAERSSGSVPGPQVSTWLQFAESLVDPARGDFPTWLDWALQMRNAILHRGQQIGFHLQRPMTSPIILLRTDPTGVMSSLRRGRAPVVP